MTASKWRPISAGGTPLPTDAFMSRAPSSWRRRSSSRQASRDRRDLVERPDPPAGRVVRVLDRDEPRDRPVRVAPVPDGLAHLLGREPPGRRLERPHDEARVHGRPAELVDEQVRPGVGEQLVARARRGSGARSGSPSSRSAGRRPPPGRRARATRRSSSLTRRILALLLVADLGARDRLAHAGRRPRRRVGAEVDEPHAAILAEGWISPCSKRRSPPAASPATAPARCGSGPRAAPRASTR